ncbi:MarR family transcriptional regulator [Galbitalea sp. SE-J8]|uniref:MarR family winged helix-turn-helix transcriptional regulator n=1 Tax=Galbitalea sp. SE-J8 TaxID=3054952 RepID=UPI00259CC2C2|nr:MarR family transcriptional regulator [Galbitalea sp. SE-J8]MDM4761746.1 MarR family transcriptional regulator [Galbitalea sp. SE-J8]
MDHEDELGTSVRTAIGRIYRRIRASRPEGELGDAAFWVLSHLHRAGPQSLGALAERERVTPAAMSQTVNRLTSAGYAERRPDPDDGRRVMFHVTEEGARLAGAARAERTAWLESKLDELDDADRAALARAAEILQRWARE